MTVENAMKQLRQIEMTAGDNLTAQQQALEAIRGVISFDAGSFATVDPATVLWTSCVLYGLDHDSAQEHFMFENEYRHHDLLKISSLSRSSVPAHRLSAFDEYTRNQSIRFQVLREYGAGDELRCAVVDNGLCWASFELYRSCDAETFTDNDANIAAALSRPIARLIRTTLLRQAAWKSDHLPDAPGVAMIDEHGEIRSMSATWPAWTDEISAGSEIPPAVRALVLQVAATGSEPRSIVIPRSSGGWLRVHAVPMIAPGGAMVSVLIEPARAPAIPQTIQSVYGFTSRENEIIILMAQGLSTKEIAVELGISNYTVNDHAKAIFHKAGVQSRQQLIARLFFDHCLPLREQNATPGPYGWFVEDSLARVTSAARTLG